MKKTNAMTTRLVVLALGLLTQAQTCTDDKLFDAPLNPSSVTPTQKTSAQLPVAGGRGASANYRLQYTVTAPTQVMGKTSAAN